MRNLNCFKFLTFSGYVSQNSRTATAEADIDKYFNQTLELGFKIEGSITNVVKTLCYLSGDLTKLKSYWLELEKEYGNDLTEIELGELLCEKINLQ